MRKITVDKEQLLETLKANKREHRETYAEACRAYSKEMAERTTKLAELFKQGEMPSLTKVFDAPRPEQFLDDYDRAIQMLEWHQDDEVTLDEDEFRRYVQNEWGWRQRFAANTASYAGS